MVHELIAVDKESDIPEEYRGTPIALLFKYHNLGEGFQPHEEASLLVVTCMDNRISLTSPRGFAFTIRGYAPRLKTRPFPVSYAVAVGRIGHIAVIGHDDCRMSMLETRREEFVAGLSERCGWDRTVAEKNFSDMFKHFQNRDEVDSVLSTVEHLRSLYTGVVAAPLFYTVCDGRLSFIAE